MSLKGSQTEANLAASFVGECVARMKYDYMSDVARKEGYEQVGAVFNETALNEAQHAHIFLNHLRQDCGGHVECPSEVSLSGIGSTSCNLRCAMDGEHGESEMYPHFASVAEKEGFVSIARSFRAIATVEKAHELRYKKLLERVESGHVFKRNKSITWKCRNCGFVCDGTSAPKACPACFFKQAFFEACDPFE